MYRGTTYIDGEMIMAGTVRAGSLEGGQILLLDEHGDAAADLFLDAASTANFATNLRSYGAMRLEAYTGQQMIQKMIEQNPQMKQAMPLVQGKNPQQLQQTFMNLCKERGIDPAQFAQQMGMNLPK